MLSRTGVRFRVLHTGAGAAQGAAAEAGSGACERGEAARTRRARADGARQPTRGAHQPQGGAAGERCGAAAGVTRGGGGKASLQRGTLSRSKGERRWTEADGLALPVFGKRHGQSECELSSRRYQTSQWCYVRSVVLGTALLTACAPACACDACTTGRATAARRPGPRTSHHGAAAAVRAPLAAGGGAGGPLPHPRRARVGVPLSRPSMRSLLLPALPLRRVRTRVKTRSIRAHTTTFRLTLKGGSQVT